MKKILYLTCLVAFIGTNMIQAQEPPRDGAIVTMKQTTITVSPGSEKEAEVLLIRSKKYKKARFGGLTARAPEGISIDFTQDAQNKDLYRMLVKVATGTPVKPYTVVVRGQGNNAHKIKGLAVSIDLGGDQIVETND